MDLKYKPWIGGLLLALALINLVLSALVGATVGIITGLIISVVGILMLTKPVVSLSPRSIGMRNLLGMEIKSHTLTDGNFSVENNKIFVDGKRRVSLGMLDADETTVRNYLSQR